MPHVYQVEIGNFFFNFTHIIYIIVSISANRLASMRTISEIDVYVKDPAASTYVHTRCQSKRSSAGVITVCAL